MKSSVVAWRTAKPRSTPSQGNTSSTSANQLAPTTCDALISSSAISRIRPATSSITNDTSLCFQKLRCFSTPHA